MKSINYYLRLVEDGSPAERKEFEDFLDSMCWDLEDFVQYLEYEEKSNEIIVEELFWKELFEDLEADQEVSRQKEQYDYEAF